MPFAAKELLSSVIASRRRGSPERGKEKGREKRGSNKMEPPIIDRSPFTGNQEEFDAVSRQGRERGRKGGKKRGGTVPKGLASSVSYCKDEYLQGI